MSGPIAIPAWDSERPPEPSLIDDCVHCGFCLPTCPTYSLWGEEADSPRGRIVLMEEGHHSELSAPMVGHLDNCLGCMACVTACPSGVQYDKLIEDTRAQVERRWRRPLRERALRRAIFALFPHPRRLALLAPFTRLAPGRMGRLAPRTRSSAALPASLAASGGSRGTVGFMQGCVQRVFFGDVNLASVRLLAAEGWNVEVPPSHRCCGALQLHAGEESATEARATIEAFERFDRVVVNAAGCGSSMKDYGHLLRDDPEWAERANTFSEKVRDLTEILEPDPAGRAVSMRVAYHDACHLAHAQGVREQPRELLRAIPGLELVEPEDWEICCGSAGIYNLVKPAAAAELGRRKAEALLATGAEAVVAANPGCALQIAAHARELGHELEVLHPAEVLGELAAVSPGIEISGPKLPESEAVLTPDALALVARLHDELDDTRRSLLAKRTERQAELDAGGTLDFLAATAEVREGDWTVAPSPAAYEDRRAEITGPTSAKMVINALNSGARGFMADFEDANSPTWQNMIEGQANLMAAVRGTLALDDPGGKEYRLGEERATLLVRPRGWHLQQRHVTVGGEPVAGGLFDFALYVHHNARELLERGSGPFLYLPKLESHLEARLWDDAITIAETQLGLDRGAIRATVLIETLPAAFEMDEILFELRDHSAGLNAGRWDYIFSAIKRLRSRADCVLPDRAQVTMTVPFMRAYTELLVKTCHRRGTHAMGGMSAVIPSRSDPEAAERAREAVASDKRREAAAGFDGSWVAHPDSVEAALGEFDAALGDRPNQIEKQRNDVETTAAGLLDIPATPGEITEAGLRTNVGVGIEYIDSWLRGNGAAAINGLMEDAATAEISRSQVWQWIHHGAQLDDGRTVTAELVGDIVAAQPAGAARELFQEVALADELVEFLTLPAYERLTG